MAYQRKIPQKRYLDVSAASPSLSSTPSNLGLLRSRLDMWDIILVLRYTASPIYMAHKLYVFGVYPGTIGNQMNN